MNTTVQTKMYLNGLYDRADLGFELRNEKFIIGACLTADVRLDHQTVSNYHAFISVLDPERILVKDLDSTYGITLNGMQIKESVVTKGDVLTIGSISFRMDVCEVSDENKTTQKPISELVFIDGEYCDILFDESSFKARTQLPSFRMGDDFVEIDELSQPEQTSHSTKAKQLEVINYVNGLILEVNYVQLKDGDYYLSPRKQSKNDLHFSTLNRTKFFNVTNDKLTFFTQDELSSNALEDLGTKARFFTHGTEQISVRLVDTSIKYGRLPFLFRSKDQIKTIAALFILLMLPYLVLPLIDYSDPGVGEAQVAVIYKLPDSEIIAQLPVEDVEENTAIPSEGNGVSADAGKVEKTGAVKFAANTKKIEPVAKLAKTEAIKGDNLAQGSGVKGYTFKSSTAMALATSTLNPSLGGKIGAKNGKGSASDTFSVKGAEDSTAVAHSGIGVSKFNSGKSNTDAKAWGAKGMVAKTGFDSSYVEPNRVEVGSMDPELLKKILKEYIPQFRHCYNQELITHSEKLKGVVNMNFRIGANGKVVKHDIKTADARFSKKGTNCMARVLSIIDFPRPKGGGIVDVKQPFNFSTDSSGQI